MPIVATRVGGIPDVVGPDEALLVPPEDPRALAAAIRSVHEDTRSARRRTCAANERLSDFAPGPWLSRYASIYRELIEAPEARTDG